MVSPADNKDSDPGRRGDRCHNPQGNTERLQNPSLLNVHFDKGVNISWLNPYALQAIRIQTKQLHCFIQGDSVLIFVHM